MRKADKIVMVAGFVASLLLAGYLVWFGILFYQASRFDPPDAALPALVRNLDGKSMQERQKSFHDRVVKKYTDGIPSQVLAAELRRQGFRVFRMSDGFVPQTTFDGFVEQHGNMCLSQWNIYWHLDPQDRARDIRGVYSWTCP